MGTAWGYKNSYQNLDKINENRADYNSLYFFLDYPTLHRTSPRVATHQTKKTPDDLFENTQITLKKPSLLIIPM